MTLRGSELTVICITGKDLRVVREEAMLGKVINENFIKVDS